MKKILTVMCLISFTWAEDKENANPSSRLTVPQSNTSRDQKEDDQEKRNPYDRSEPHPWSIKHGTGWVDKLLEKSR